MSQENNLNLNIAGILNEIKGMSDEQIEQIENNWREIPAERVLIYKGVMSALESNNYEQMRGKFYELACSIFAQNAVITHLDVEIIMSFVEKVLEKAGDQNPEDQQWTNIVQYLFDSLGRATLKLYQSGTKIESKDLKSVISLAGKVLKCGNVTHTNLCFAGNNVFAAINNFIDMLSENIEVKDITDIISLAQIVANDNGIKWDNAAINSIFCALSSLLVKSSNLDQQQAVDMVELITKFTDKLEPNDQFLVVAVHRMLDTLCVVLYNKNNPSKLDVKNCMNLVFGLLHKIDGSAPNTNLNIVRGVTNLVTAVVKYYAQNQGNIAIIENCGFNIENGQVKSLNMDNFKAFAGEFMADCWDHLTFTITKSQNYEKIMSLLNAEAPGAVDTDSLAAWFSDLCNEVEKYNNDKMETLEDVVAVTKLIDRILNLDPAVTLTNDMVSSMFYTFSYAASRVAGINRNQIELEESRVKTVMSFVEKVLGSDSKIKSDRNVVWCSFNCLGNLLRRIVPTEIGYANSIIELINGVAINEDINLGKYEISLMFDLFEIIMQRNPNCLEAEEGLRLVGKLLNKVTEIYEKDRVNNITNRVLSIISVYAKNEENIAIIENCGFNIESGQIKSLKMDNLKAFAGEYVANAIQQVLLPKLPNLSKDPESENKNKNGNQVNDETNSTTTGDKINKKINSTEKDKFSEMLWHYKSADELLTNEVDKEKIASYLANVKVSLWDKFKALPSWLWFMIRKQKLVSLDIYTRAAKHYSGDKNKTQDDNQGVKNLNLGNKDKDDSEKEISLKDKMQNVLSNQPKSENGQRKDNSETLGNGD